MVASVIESGELICNPSKVSISYVMNGWEKILLYFIKNDKHVALYMFDTSL